MNEENILCGRKLEFGDSEQLGVIHHIDKLIQSFIIYSKRECDIIMDYEIIDAMKECQNCCGCDDYYKLEDEIEGVKRSGIINN